MGYSDEVVKADRAVQRLLGGEPVTYVPAVGAPATPIGIFDEQFVLAKGDANAGVEALGPAVFFRLEDLPADPETDDPTLTIRGIAYKVTERRPSGLGGIVLALRAVA